VGGELIRHKVELGVVKEWAIADIIIFDGNPL
jgi:hypothetical protein